MPTFPATLPAPALNTLNEQVPNNLIRSSMDKGYDKVRRRTTANVRLLSFVLKLIPSQVQTLDDFYMNDVKSGSLSFDYTHPRTGASVTARFVEPPSYSEKEGVMYEVNVQLEVLP